MKPPLGRLLHMCNPFLKEEWEKVNLPDMGECNKKSRVL
jgi:hypothetical protein